MCRRFVIKRGTVVVCKVHLRHVAIVLVFRQRIGPRGSGAARKVLSFVMRSLAGENRNPRGVGWLTKRSFNYSGQGEQLYQMDDMNRGQRLDTAREKSDQNDE